MRWIGVVAAIVGAALMAYAVPFLVSAALILFVLGVVLVAGGIWVLRAKHHA